MLSGSSDSDLYQPEETETASENSDVEAATSSDYGSDHSAASGSASRGRYLHGRWTPEEDERLRQGVAMYKGQWKKIAAYVGSRASQQCLHRWRKSVQPGITRTRWQPHEDDLLRASVAKLGPVWTKVQKLVPGRTDVQCRERWVNILDPSICQEPWTQQEDMQLKRLVREIGKGKWSQIAQHMTRRRTDYACRKRWEKICRRMGN